MKLVSAVLGLLVLAGFCGALHPAGDTLAVFRAPLLVLFALAVIWSAWPRRLRWPLAGLAILGLLPHAGVVGADAGTGAAGGVTLYQQNLLWKRSESAEWLAAVRAARPDFLTLQEVSAPNLALLEALRPLYPYQQFCPLRGKLGEAVLSRHPIVPGSGFCSKRDGFAALQADPGSGPVWVVSMHLNWPWPSLQWTQVEALLPELERLQGPVILGGDLNAVAWSHSVAQLQAATRTRRVGGYVSTFTLPWFPMPIGIDHVLAPEGRGHVTALEPLGSDHRGLWAVVPGVAGEAGTYPAAPISRGSKG
ncbi:endonuclease/exonuclease/phosphatase family protein [Tropicibacter oceani]|uniref:Endonuclease/exonuclease/phosphatase family protein n=1 Tax=Tropicibacter oceani TaxID=3058420 RepID=A0ABY8QD77_9RHOB|nr:endonuclease/exonuclease/phosphatase family protein [Tropicibacter oceani]WGW02454.1 endonuclease/exonuclease/phosphatase family protein [Tropicibacter oceani]